MEHSKTEMFHFSRLHSVFNPSSLDLTALGGSILLPKTTWQYLGFFFNQKLMFHHRINFYTNKAISTIKCMKMLGNLSRSLVPLQKRQLYICCALPITLYSFQLWYYNKAPLDYPLRILRKMQQRAALWISSTFQTSPTAGIEAIAGLIPIHLYLKKLQGRFHLRGFLLPSNHIIKSIIGTSGSNEHIAHHHLSLNKLMHKQWLWLYSPLIDMDDKCNKFLPFFSLFNKEFSLGKRLINSFSDHFSFHAWKQDIKGHLCDLDNITISASTDSHSITVILDASIRNNIVTSISHIHSYNRPIIKTIHHTININSTEAELFAIRCGINQANNIPNIKHIVVITDSLHMAKKIFNSLMHPYQIHFTAISQELRDFFKKDSNNCIDF